MLLYKIVDVNKSKTIMKDIVNINLNIPQTDIGLLEKLAKKMGWNMTRNVAPPSSIDKFALLQRLYGCVNLPADFDYKAAVSDVLNEKYGLR